MRKVNKLTHDQQVLVEQNEKLIYTVLHNKNLQVEDYYGVAAIGLCLAACTYKQEIGTKFSTYAYTCISNQLDRELNHENKKSSISKNELLSLNYEYEKKDNGIESLSYIIADSDHIEDDVITNVMFQRVCENFSRPEYKIITDALLQNMRQREIAEIIGKKPQWVQQLRETMKYDYIAQGFHLNKSPK